MTETNLHPVIQEMLKPGFYPHPVKEPIKLIQTHISYVFLTGDYAYKVKKAINFGFLDFSTLELREHFLPPRIGNEQTRRCGNIFGSFTDYPNR